MNKLVARDVFRIGRSIGLPRFFSGMLVGLICATTEVAAQTGTATPSDQTYNEDYSSITLDEEKYPDLLDGTLSAKGDLEEDEAPKSGHLRLPTLLDPWFAYKAMIREKYGISIGGSYGVLWQNYQESLLGEDNSVGSKFTLNLSAELLNRGAPDALSFDMAVEDRRPLGTDQPPLFAGLMAGSITATAATWGDFNLGITQAYVRQNLFDGRFQYAVGKLFAPNFVNAYPFFDDNRQFLNQIFATSPTIAVPLRGFGLTGAVYPTDGNFYVSAGMYTPYSSDTGATIDDFFTRNQYFYNAEFGVSSLAASGVPVQARGPMDANNYHISTWYRDELDDGTPEAYGVAFNANQMVGTNFMWFLRGGWSEGTNINLNLTAGVGYRPPSAPSDLFGVGIGWANPSDSLQSQAALLGLDLGDQYTFEMFYRYHLTPNFAITPDIQLIANPADIVFSPSDDDLLAVFGLRARVTY